MQSSKRRTFRISSPIQNIRNAVVALETKIRNASDSLWPQRKKKRRQQKARQGNKSKVQTSSLICGAVRVAVDSRTDDSHVTES